MVLVMQTNRDLIAQSMRVQVAGKQPKTHIPVGIGGFFLISVMSPIGWLPWAFAALVYWDAEKRLAKNGDAIKKSYGYSQLPDGRMVSNAHVLEKRLGKKEREMVGDILSVYTPELPVGQKKPQPLPSTKSQQLPREGTKPTGARPAAETKGEAISDNPTPTPAPSGSTKTPENGSIVDEGWFPQDLPTGFVEYLASQIHILVAATTGSGKTWLLRNLATYVSNQGHHLVIADPKGTQWGELSPAVLRMKSGSDYTALLKDLHRELEIRIELLQQGKPVGPHLWAIFDEWMLFKGKASALDPAGRAALQQRLLDIIAAGRELNMHLIMVNQSHILGDLSLSGGKNTFSSGLRDNLCTLGLGCKTTKDNAGNPMQGNSKSIDNMLRDQYLVSDANDRNDAAAYHAGLRRGNANRTFCLYASQLFIGQTPDLTIPKLERIRPFPNVKVTEPNLYGDEWGNG